MAFASAACFALAFPPVSWWWMAPGGYAGVVLFAARAALDRRTVAALFLTALALWLWFEWWLVQVAAIGYPILAFYLASYWVLALWTLRRCRRSALGARLPWAVLAPIVIVGIEWLRGSVVMDGYPWFLIGQVLIDTPCAQIADLGGVPLVTLLCVAVTGVGVDLLERVDDRSSCRVGRRARQVAAIGTLALVAGAAIYGWQRIREMPGHLRDGPAILVFQPNLSVSNSVAWPRELQERDVGEFARSTIALWTETLRSGNRVDLTVWPETILPGFGLEPATIATLVNGGWWPGARFAQVPKAIAELTGVPMLLGSPAYLDLIPEDERWSWSRHYNSAYLVVPDGSVQRYDKSFLTPFGETMPYISKWEWLEQQLLSVSAVGMTFDLDEGEVCDPLALRFSSTTVECECPIATPICFEDTVPHVVRRLVYGGDGVRRASVIVNLSNDGWFGSSDAGREQHALIARWRCIELRTPMVRAANTGISEAFDSAGRPLSGARVGARTSGGFVVQCRLDSRETIYGHFGDVLSPVMCALTVLMLMWPRVRSARGAKAVVVMALSLAATAGFPGCAKGTLESGRAVVDSTGGSSWSSRPPRSDATIVCASAPETPEIAEAPPIPHVPPTPEAPETTHAAATAALEAPPPAEPAVSLEKPPPAEPAVAVVSVAAAPSESAEPPSIESSVALTRAMAILLAASQTDQPIYRVHALEGLEHSPTDLLPVLRRLLADENPGVRFAAAVIVGKRKLQECAELVEPLALDPNASVRAAALYALVRLGRSVDLSPLAELVMSYDTQTRSNALLVLGELRNPSAIPLVESVVGRRLDTGDPTRLRLVDLQAAEAMAKMGDYRQYDPIRAALFAPSEQSEIVALACQMVGETEDRGARDHLIGLWNGKGPLERPLEVRLIAGASLARIGEENLEPIYQVCGMASRDQSPAIRAQAAATLGWAGGPQARTALTPLLDDPAPMVRLTAAAAYLRASR